ncbi:helix-turn-helix domain-containing protein [Streptomyces sp. NPDC059076]|uniref:AraC-like ligand-binding domain-containing protein n=1 Tax=unclassified Streptomyces TaxID=2593676 RepID=UPI0036B86852
MIETVFSTEDLPQADRWAEWYDLTTRAYMPSELSTAHQDDFHARVHLVDLGPVQVSRLVYSPVMPRRTPKLIRQADAELYQLSLALHGTFGLAQAGSEALAGPQDMMVHDSSRPFHGWTASQRGTTVSHLLLQIPRSLLPVSPNAVAQLTAVRLAGQEGIGALLARHLADLHKNAASYTPADAARLATITLDLLAALCAHHLEATRSLPPETRTSALQTQIHDFIQQRLGDPALGPDAIAAAHHISTRYLYTLFRAQGLTVSDWIRRRRLDRCRRDLTDPHLRSLPVHAIAARWGFTDGANFSRAFRTAYGTPPHEYRTLIQSLPRCAERQELCAPRQRPFERLSPCWERPHRTDAHPPSGKEQHTCTHICCSPAQL